MKFKSLFLGSLAAVAFASCNNEVINTDQEINTKPDEVIAGLPIYASFDFTVKSPTYAGDIDVAAFDAEKIVKDAVVYIYKSGSGSGLEPENIVYIAMMGTAGQNGENNKITLKTTSGPKKIFVALNVKKANPAPIDLLPITGAGVVSSPLPNTQLFDVVNNILYSQSATAVSLAPPTGAGSANGLIKALALELKSNNIGSGATGGGYAATYTDRMLMTNWDGNTDTVAVGTKNLSTCAFSLIADKDSLTSRNGTTVATNSLEINVQRAFAKVSLTISATAATVTVVNNDFSDKGYMAAAGTLYEGKFQPWTANGATPANAPVWSVGNIAKQSYPFQMYDGQYIRSPFYNALDDSCTTAGMSKWLARYDNSRIFGSTMAIYPSPSYTVAMVKGNMQTTDNFVSLSTSPSAVYFAHVTENAREMPVLHDHGTYVIIGGRYIPKEIITDIKRRAVTTNKPIIFKNNVTTTTIDPNGAEQADPPTPYAWTPVNTDTMFYLPNDKVFIKGRVNLYRYYAWEKQYWKEAPDNGATGTVNDFITPPNGTQVVNAINADASLNNIMEYAGAQCWYRVFLQIPKNAVNPSVQDIVIRNHIYAVDIHTIKGPGIADPNKIISPGTPISPLDTYVTAKVTVLDWHQIDQVVEVDQN